MKKFTITRVAALAATVAVLTTGCTITTDPDSVVPTRYVESVAVAPAAKASVGEQDAKAAAQAAVTFTLAHGTEENLLDPQRKTYTVDELGAGLQQALTPETYASWQQVAPKIASGDRAERESFRGLKVFALDEPTWRRPAARPIIQSQDVTHVKVEARPHSADNQRLSSSTSVAQPQEVTVSLEHRTIAHFATDHSPVEAVIDRQVSYVMQKTPDRGWLISEYNGNYEIEADPILR
ncbi:hypothetical protein [Nigerium massiliense]|uniref:hypothetical protein n=1 Tax=Nigerium massiliense TaxID=1522317 RepID=UPI000590BD0F|nr:hypothetical protein [Nigerium massiliense]